VGRSLALMLAPIALLGCGAPASENSPVADVVTVPEPASTDASTTITPSVTGTTPSSSQRYSTVTTIIERPPDGPRLCLGGQLDSAPPICGDVAVVGLDWNAVSGANHSGDVIWMEQAFVTGTYSDGVMTLTEQPHHATAAETSAAFDRSNGPVPCAEPAEGWAATGGRFPPGSDYNASIEMVDAVTVGSNDWGGAWIEYIGGTAPADLQSHPEAVILVELFTGDLARHETELRSVWPGALCVASAATTSAEIEALAQKISADEYDADSLDPLLRQSAVVDYSRGTIRVVVAVATPALQAAFDAKYGVGVVVVSGVLRPIAGA